MRRRYPKDRCFSSFCCIARTDRTEFCTAEASTGIPSSTCPPLLLTTLFTRLALCVLQLMSSKKNKDQNLKKKEKRKNCFDGSLKCGRSAWQAQTGKQSGPWWKVMQAGRVLLKGCSCQMPVNIFLKWGQSRPESFGRIIKRLETRMPSGPSRSSKNTLNAKRYTPRN